MRASLLSVCYTTGTINRRHCTRTHEDIKSLWNSLLRILSDKSLCVCDYVCMHTHVYMWKSEQDIRLHSYHSLFYFIELGYPSEPGIHWLVRLAEKLASRLCLALPPRVLGLQMCTAVLGLACLLGLQAHYVCATSWAISNPFLFGWCWEEVLLCIFGWPGTCYINQDGFELSFLYLPTYLPIIHLSIYLPIIHLSVYLPICLSIYLSTYLPIIDLSVCLSIYLSISLSIYLPTYHSSICLSVNLSISVYLLLLPKCWVERPVPLHPMLFFKHLFICVSVCLCMHLATCLPMHMCGNQDNLESVLSFHYVSTRSEIEIVRVSSKHLYLLCHLNGHCLFLETGSQVAQADLELLILLLGS